MASSGGAGDTSDALAEARAVVVGRLRARRQEIDLAVFRRISSERFDRTGAEEPEYVAGLRAAGVAFVGYVLGGIESSASSLGPVPRAVLEQARRDARIGVRLETVLRRHLAAHTLLRGLVIQEIERSGARSQNPAMRHVLGVTSTFFDRLIFAASSAYKREIARGVNTASVIQDNAKPAPSRPISVRLGLDASPRHGASRAAIASWQRERLLAAIVEVVAERGHAGGVVPVTRRAKVSTKTFYQQFPNGFEDGLLAVTETALVRIGTVVSAKLEEADTWQDQVRTALAALLVFVNSEPELVKVCIAQAWARGAVGAAHRELMVNAFHKLIGARIEREVALVSPFSAESVTFSMMNLIYSSLVSDEKEPPIKHLGPLMGKVIRSFVVEGSMRVDEKRRGDELARAILAGDPGWLASQHIPVGDPAHPAEDFAARPPRRLGQCLLYIAEQNEREVYPSNREVAAAIGIIQPSQISRLLKELEQENLAFKRSSKLGGRTEWQLTTHGQETSRALRQAATKQGAAAGPHLSL